ncbi:hypothetical protein [Ancylobacter sp. SL191]|uniref:hypothetical protein n=1 Tax=Ancylobacter sp. SL191 TaxID=2995166 RepID=UPI002270942A|nr:hypothetical protein [Ancylobacter sp. SL191]WAC28631.1 hypothetical protein OU996_06170 [Ancylobacter sp. SL191]
MARLLLSTLLAPRGPVGQFFGDLIGQLEARGHSVVLWAPEPLAGREAQCLPLPWPLHKLAGLYPASGPTRFSALEVDAALWSGRIAHLARQGAPASQAPALYAALRAASEQVLEATRPDLFVAWNPYAPHTGVAYALCRAAGIATATLERGLLPATYHLDRSGFLGASAVAGVALEELLPAADWPEAARAGAAYVENWPLESLARITEKAPRTAPEGTHAAGADARLIAFLTTDDATVGTFPAGNPDRPLYMPHVADSFKAARAVALACPQAQVLIKAHPSITHLTDVDDLPANARIVDTPPLELLREADLAVSMGGSLNVMAVRLGTPLVHLVRDPFSGKGVFFEPEGPDDLARCIELAASATPAELEARRARFDALSGYLIRDYYICHPSMQDGTRGVADAVALLESALPAAPSAEAAPAFRREEVVREPSGAAGFPLPPVTPEEVRAALAGPSGRTVFLDFDHTLFAGNTTEEYLRQARPALLVSLILAFVRGFLPWRKFFGKHWFRFRDYAAVVAVTLLMPWNLARWRRNAPALFAARGAHELAQALKVVPAERTVIVSFGFDMLIGPLVKGTHWESCRRACVPFQLHPRVLKTLRHGKARLIGGLFPPRVVATAALVTDSEDDRDLLDQVKIPLLVEPVGEKSAAEESFYLPMRYTALAKYNAYYVRKQTLFVELPLLLLATLPLAGAPWLWLGAALALFVSMLAVYEIGYFENDQVAAAREANPTLTPMAARFRDFPLARHAWSWAIALGLVGALLASLRATGGTLDTGVFALFAGLWLAALLAVRGLFYGYNRLPEPRRILLYPLLQSAKLLAPLLLLPGLALGAALLLAQTVAMWMTYAVYRAGGDKEKVPRNTVRAVSFIVLAAGTLLASPAGTLHTEAVAGGLILAWLLRERWMGLVRRSLAKVLNKLRHRRA